MTGDPLVLVVDDDADIRLLLRHILTAGGFRVSEAPDASGIVELAAGPPAAAAVVLDVQMPDVDGWEALAALRAAEATRTLPVVMCTVKASLEDSRRGWELGCDAYIPKPFDVQALVAELRRLLATSAAEREQRREAEIRRVLREELPSARG